jgi:hypothetical protein
MKRSSSKPRMRASSAKFATTTWSAQRRCAEFERTSPTCDWCVVCEIHTPARYHRGAFLGAMAWINQPSQRKVLYSIFPKDQVIIFFFEELSAAPQAVAHRLYDFIGVKPDFLPPSLYKRVNVNAKPRSRVAARFVQYIHRQSWKHSHYLSNLIGQIKQIRPLRRLVRATLYKETESSSDWREHIREFPDDILSRYESEICALESMLGKDLAEWHAPPLNSADPTRVASPSSDRPAQAEKPSAAMASNGVLHQY